MVVMALMVAWLGQSPALAQNDDDQSRPDWSHISLDAPRRKAPTPVIDASHPNDPLYDWAQTLGTGQLPSDNAVDPNCPHCHASRFPMARPKEPNWNGSPCNTGHHQRNEDKMDFRMPALANDDGDSALQSWLKQQPAEPAPPPAPDKPKVVHHRRKAPVDAKEQLAQTDSAHGSGAPFDGAAASKPTTDPAPTNDAPKPPDPQPDASPTDRTAATTPASAPPSASTPSRYSTASISVPQPNAPKAGRSGYDVLTGIFGGESFGLIGALAGSIGGPIGIAIGGALGAVFGALLGLF